MKNPLTISYSPHIQSGQSIPKIMYAVVIAMLPMFAVSILYFGLGALLVTLVSVVSTLSFEWLIQKFLLKVKPTISDGSALITGMLLAFNVPSNLPLWMVIIGALVAIGVGKMSFGGLGNNPFNPALVGRVFLLISFPVQMTSWPKPIINRMTMVDVQTGATPLGILKEGLKAGDTMSQLLDKLPTYMDMFLGAIGGSLGEISAIAVIIGGIYLLMKKIISWHVPTSILVTVFLFTGILYLASPEYYADPVFHLLAGGLMIGAVFMATDMVTSPMSGWGMVIYGIGIGIITVLIRVFGAYPEGVSFAILIMNAFVPLINMYFKPKRFGEVKENG
ncbi:MAG: RnfABCDGE type electron transport complex subunit D [Bacteroidales bacterium]|nr:RnfABCDGE type electron transport complex subunit D [Bacteroidales bacterium]